VFEVGMGGTWDATNLVRGDVAVLCPIGLDHPQLGSTVAEVAGEKAGIIKEGRTAVVRTQRPQALAVIERRAASVGATLALEGDAFGLARRSPGVGGQSIEVAGLHGRYSELFVAMFGEDNARGAAAAVAACESLLGRALDEEAVREALSAADSPGRMEVVSRRPVVVLDGAHNPDAMKSLAAALAEAFRWRRLHLVVAMFDDKDVEGALAFIAPLVGRAYVCSNSSPRAADPDRVAEALGASGVREIERFDGVRAALTAARTEAHEEDLILVTGSFYTVGDARPLFLRPSRPPRRSEDDR
jgi:dihydrofolate synthase / folylpolyglutamate synthase